MLEPLLLPPSPSFFPLLLLPPPPSLVTFPSSLPFRYFPLTTSSSLQELVVQKGAGEDLEARCKDALARKHDVQHQLRAMRDDLETERKCRQEAEGKNIELTREPNQIASSGWLCQ